MAAGGTILVASNGGLTTLTLNRPDKLNSFNEAMHAELRTALEHCAADPGCRAILLTGAGRAFCAGQDLSDRAMSADEEPPDLGDTLDRLYNPLIQLVRTLEAHRLCRQRCCRGCQGQPGSCLRHRPGSTLGQLHPGVLQAGSRPRRGRHLASAAPRRRGR